MYPQCVCVLHAEMAGGCTISTLRWYGVFKNHALCVKNYYLQERETADATR